MITIEMTKDKSDLKDIMDNLRKTQIEYLQIMHFLENIRGSLNRAFKNKEYTFEGLKETSDLIDRQIDGYKYTSSETIDVSYYFDEAIELLEQIYRKLDNTKISNL